MTRACLMLATTALALPVTAFGKGPSAAVMSGPGGGSGISFTGDGDSGGTPLGDLTQQAGFFAATFGQQPDPMLTGRPNVFGVLVVALFLVAASAVFLRGRMKPAARMAGSQS